MALSISKFGHLARGEKIKIQLNGNQLKVAIDRVRMQIDPNREILNEGQKILDLILRYSDPAKFILPKINISENLLRKFEAAKNPQEVIPLRELEEFIDAYNRDDQKIRDEFLKKYELGLLPAFSIPKETSGRLMLLSGPAGVGKGTIQDDFLLPKGLPKWVFYNIRDRRPREWNGVTYYFVSGATKQERCYKLIEMNQQDKFIATAVVHSEETKDIPNRRTQGIKKILFDLIEQGENYFLEVDIKLAAQLAMRGRLKGLKVNYVFLLPPSFEELMDRLTKRAVLHKGENLSEKDLNDIKNRLKDGLGEMLFSFLLHPHYVINAEKQEDVAARDVERAYDLMQVFSAAMAQTQPGRKISGRITIQEYDKSIRDAQAQKEEGLELLPANYPLILSVPGEVREIFKELIRSTVLVGGSLKVADLFDNLEDSKFQTSVCGALGFNPIELVAQIHPAVPKKYTIGIQPGTLAPYHFGHLSAAQAAILDGSLAGVVVLSGGDPPEKPFVVAARHREAMVRLGLKNPYLHYSPLRIQMMELLSSTILGGLENEKLIKSREKILKSGTEADRKALLKAEEQERRLRDLAAFSYLISLNPHLKWEYIIGVDKVNKYGISGKNEKELVMDLLVAKGIPIRWYAREKETIRLFEKEEDFVKNNPGEISWALEHQDLVEKHLIRGVTPSAFDITATRIRKSVANGISLLDDLSREIISYIFDHDLGRAYGLEDEAKELNKNLKEKTITVEKAKEILDRINKERKELFDQGILADGRPLSIEDIALLD